MRITLFMFLNLCVAAPPASGQNAGPLKAPSPERGEVIAEPDTAVWDRNQFTLDVNFAGLGVTYARPIRAFRVLGAGVGLGGDALNSMLLSGSHFSQENRLAYEDRDPYGGEQLLSVAHLDVFTRTDLGLGRYWELGLRGSMFLHWDDSDDDPGFGTFLGLYAAPMLGSDRFHFGPRVLAGFFSEERVEFGILFELLTGRVLWSW